MTTTLRSVWVQPDETFKLDDNEEIVSHKFIFDAIKLKNGIFDGKWLLLVAKTTPGLSV